jgi:hypothetical protein
MRSVIVVLLALACVPARGFAKEPPSAIGHEIQGHRFLSAPEKRETPPVKSRETDGDGKEAAGKTADEQKPAPATCAAPSGLDAAVAESVTVTARSDLDNAGPEALADRGRASVARLAQDRSAPLDAVKSYYVFGVCQALSERGQTGVALEGALASLRTALESLEVAGNAEPFVRAPEETKDEGGKERGGPPAEAKPGEVEPSQTEPAEVKPMEAVPVEPVQAPPASEPAKPAAEDKAEAGEPADHGPAGAADQTGNEPAVSAPPVVDDAARETVGETTPPDEQKAIDLALRPFEGDDRSVAPAAQGGARSEAKTETGESGGKPIGQVPGGRDSDGPAAKPERVAPVQSAAVAPGEGLVESDCHALGVLDRCSELNAVIGGLLRKPVEYNHPKTMEFGRKSEISLALRADGKGTEPPGEVSETFKGLPGDVARAATKVAEVLSAQLVGREFDIDPKGMQERTAPTGQEAVWRWTVTPTESGAGKHLTLQLYAHVGDRNGTRLPVLIKTLDASIDVDVRPLDWLINQVRTMEPIYGLIAVLIGGFSVVFSFLMRRRTARPTVSADDGEVLGDLRETTGSSRHDKTDKDRW